MTTTIRGGSMDGDDDNYSGNSMDEGRAGSEDYSEDENECMFPLAVEITTTPEDEPTEDAWYLKDVITDVTLDSSGDGGSWSSNLLLVFLTIPQLVLVVDRSDLVGTECSPLSRFQRMNCCWKYPVPSSLLPETM